MVTLIQSRSLELYYKHTCKTCQINEERLLFASLNLYIIIQEKSSEKCPLYWWCCKNKGHWIFTCWDLVIVCPPPIKIYGYAPVSYSSEPVMRLDWQILLKSPPLNLLAGSAPALILHKIAPKIKVQTVFRRSCFYVVVPGKLPANLGKFGLKWCLKCFDLKKCARYEMKMQSFFLEVILFGIFSGKFGEIWAKIYHTPKMCLLLHVRWFTYGAEILKGSKLL